MHDNDIHCSRTHLNKIPGPVERRSFFTRPFSHMRLRVRLYREGSGHHTTHHEISGALSQLQLQSVAYELSVHIE